MLLALAVFAPAAVLAGAAPGLEAAPTTPGAAASAGGERLYREAAAFEAAGQLDSAYAAYDTAAAMLRAEGRNDLAEACRYARQRIQKLALSYALTEAALRAQLREQYPRADTNRIEGVIRSGRLDSRRYSDTVCYFTESVNTATYLDLEILRSNRQVMKRNNAFAEIIQPWLKLTNRADPLRPFVRPERYVLTHEINIPRRVLPASGTLRLWLPLPILTACQRDIEIVTLSPRKYFKLPPRTDGDIGIVFLEVPLAELRGTLQARVVCRFTRDAQSFAVDPERVGDYDRTSELYRRYTASTRAIAVTPEIQAQALAIAGHETNSWRIARLLYEYVVRRTTYSFTPHLSLAAEGASEAGYVHEHKYGDCGAQGAYFTALCRALGIPARTCGGWQLFPGHAGTHFWAEFYLPNYGWIPADPSVAQLAFVPKDMPEVERDRIVDFFFGHQDPYRLVIQNDLDVPFIPAAREPVMLPYALQQAQMNCATMDTIPELVLGRYCRMKVGPAR